MRNNVQSKTWLANLLLPDMAERRDVAVIFDGSIDDFKRRAYLGLYGRHKSSELQMARCLALMPASRADAFITRKVITARGGETA
jgi:hypothetical protein